MNSVAHRFRWLAIGSLAVALFAISTGARPGEPDQLIRAGDVDTHAGADTLGPYYTITWTIPTDLSDRTLAQALLELYVDVGARPRGNYLNEAPVFEVVARPQVDGNFAELEGALRASRPILVGQRRRVLLDITSIVRARLKGAGGNRLVVGSLTGMRDGDFRLVAGELGPDVVGRVRIYQRRNVQR